MLLQEHMHAQTWCVLLTNTCMHIHGVPHAYEPMQAQVRAVFVSALA